MILIYKYSIYPCFITYDLKAKYKVQQLVEPLRKVFTASSFLRIFSISPCTTYFTIRLGEICSFPDFGWLSHQLILYPSRHRYFRLDLDLGSSGAVAKQLSSLAGLFQEEMTSCKRSE